MDRLTGGPDCPTWQFVTTVPIIQATMTNAAIVQCERLCDGPVSFCRISELHLEIPNSRSNGYCLADGELQALI